MQNQRSTFVCKRCGTNIDIRRRLKDGSLQCPQCKVVYRPKPFQPQQQTLRRKPQRRKKPVKLILALVVLLLLLIILVGSCGNNENEAAPANEINPQILRNQANIIGHWDDEAGSGLLLSFFEGGVCDVRIPGLTVKNGEDIADLALWEIQDDKLTIFDRETYSYELSYKYNLDGDILRWGEFVLTREPDVTKQPAVSGGQPSLKIGELLSVTETPTYLFDDNDNFIGTEDNIVVVKAKISPSYNNKATIKQNYLNIEDLIKRQGFDKYNELQYWAVADMTDGSESKVFSCTVSKSLIDSIKEDLISVEGYEVMVDDLWILPSLLQ